MFNVYVKIDFCLMVPHLTRFKSFLPEPESSGRKEFIYLYFCYNLIHLQL